MNKITIIGNVTHSPEFKTTPNGVKVCVFTVAVNPKFGDREATFFRVSAWRGLAEICDKYLEKGKKVAVVGEVSARAYAAKDGSPKASLEINADEVEFLSARNQQAEPDEFVEISDEELPFK